MIFGAKEHVILTELKLLEIPPLSLIKVLFYKMCHPAKYPWTCYVRNRLLAFNVTISRWHWQYNFSAWFWLFPFGTICNMNTVDFIFWYKLVFNSKYSRTSRIHQEITFIKDFYYSCIIENIYLCQLDLNKLYEFRYV